MSTNNKFENKEGQKVPVVTFPIRVNDDWNSRDTQEIFAGKTVVVFSLPGAFTPTCSSSHLPRYNELAGKFAANGVDEILCVSVNDTFVMNRGQKIKLLKISVLFLMVMVTLLTAWVY